jgi:hypothetical protein
MKIYLQARELFKNAKNLFHIKFHFQIVFQDNSVIRILKDRNSSIYKTWYKT